MNTRGDPCCGTARHDHDVRKRDDGRDSERSAHQIAAGDRLGRDRQRRADPPPDGRSERQERDAPRAAHRTASGIECTPQAHRRKPDVKGGVGHEPGHPLEHADAKPRVGARHSMNPAMTAAATSALASAAAAVRPSGRSDQAASGSGRITCSSDSAAPMFASAAHHEPSATVQEQAPRGRSASPSGT